MKYSKTFYLHLAIECLISIWPNLKLSFIVNNMLTSRVPTRKNYSSGMEVIGVLFLLVALDSNLVCSSTL
jgi:hypothetical protein